MELKFALEDLLGRTVDLVTVKALRPRLAGDILWDVVENRVPVLHGTLSG